MTEHGHFLIKGKQSLRMLCFGCPLHDGSTFTFVSIVVAMFDKAHIHVSEHIWNVLSYAEILVEVS